MSTNIITHLSSVSLVVVPEPSAKALSHYHSSLMLWGVYLIWNILILGMFSFTGFSARMQSWAARLGRNWYFTFAFYSVAFLLVYFLVSLPLYYYLGYVHPHHYDLSNQTIGKWLGDYFKGMAVMMVGALAAAWVPFLLMKKSPRRWWFYSGLLTLPFLCFVVLIQPVWIDPLFHKFQPLQNKALESRILALAARAGIEGSRVYEVNMSADTKTVNAYVNGFMGTKRIVFWDTILKDFDQDELMFVLGHEMGHYVLGHIVKIIAFDSVLFLLLFYAVHLLAGRIIALFKTLFGFNSLSDFAAAPLGLLLILFVVLVGMPILMAFSRHLEHEADCFGLELTHKNHAAATSFVKFQQIGLSIPRPWPLVHFWLGTHPTIAERIDFCNSYHPWESAKPSRYQDYIKPSATP